MERVTSNAALIALGLLCATPGIADVAQIDDPAVVQERPRIGLVLSGGGARGAAHAGILKILEEHRIPVDVIVGTSIGALVGSYYASGMSPDEIIDWLERLDWQSALADRPPRRSLSFRRKQDDSVYALTPPIGFRDGHFILPQGLLSGHELGYQMRTKTLHTARWASFDDFPIPFRAVATDIESGERVVLDRGSLGDVLLASMAVPGVVAPVVIDGRLLLDGGLVDNLPVSVAKELGADIIIAVDISRALESRDELQDMFGISMQVIAMIGQEYVRQAIDTLGPDDVLIQPELGDISPMDFGRMAEAIARGFAVRDAVSPRLAELTVDETTWNAWLAAHRQDDREWPVIDFIEIDNATGVSDELIAARITMQVGERLSPRDLRRDIDLLHSIGEFDRIDFSLVERDGESGLGITVTPRRLGPNHLRFGLSFDDAFSGRNAYRFVFMHTRTQLNALNGEWRSHFQVGETMGVSTELFQPLTWSGSFFVNPGASMTRETFELFDDGSRVAQYSVKRGSVSFDTGVHRRNYGEARIGIFLEDIDANPRIGDPGIERIDERVTGLQWSATFDQLDNWSFPRDAWWVTLSGRHGFERLGGQRRFGRVELSATGAQPLGARDTVMFGIRAGGRTTGELPLHEQFPLGGFLSLSGLRRDELRGDYMFLVRAAWYRRILQLPTGLGDGVYFGLSHERGNVWDVHGEARLGDLRWGASAFVGAESTFGAIYLGVGRADNGDTSGFLYLQRTFQ